MPKTVSAFLRSSGARAGFAAVRRLPTSATPEEQIAAFERAYTADADAKAPKVCDECGRIHRAGVENSCDEPGYGDNDNRWGTAEPFTD